MRWKRSTRGARGFSLIEMLVSAAIVGLAVAAASSLMVTQWKAYRNADLTRRATVSSRNALTQLETTLRILGFGIDPRYGIDFHYNCPAWPTKCRDRIDGPDQLAFVSRNPLYQWLSRGEPGCATVGGCFSGNAWAISSVATGTTPKTVTLFLPTGAILEKGRVVLAQCTNANSPVMFTLSQTYVGADADVTLTPVATNAAPYNDWNNLAACHGVAGAGLFLVDRYRYFVGAYGGVGWLMLDTGRDLNQDGTLPPGDQANLIPVAKNVVDMQVAYALNRDPTAGAGPDATNTDWVIGNASGVAEEPNRTLAAPLYTTPANDALRYNLHPANIRGVRVTLTLRSDMRDTGRQPGWSGDTLPNAENRTAGLPTGAFRLYTAETSVSLRNLESTTSFTF